MTKENLYMIEIISFSKSWHRLKPIESGDSRTDVLNTVTIVLVNGPIFLIKHVFLR